MKTTHATSIVAATALAMSAASADLATDLVAYYDFEQADANGLLNKAPGATGFNLTWGTSGSLSQTGFTGNAAFSAPDGASDRGTPLAGNALNLVDAENAYLVAPIGSSDLGNVFTISMWTYLAYGETNGSNRFHALEAKDSGVWDVSWGTTSTVNTTGYDDYVAFVETQTTSTISDLIAFEWQHVILEYDLTGNPTVSVYVNGNTTPVTAIDTSGTFAFTALNIGRHRDGTGDRDWDGMIDEVAVWNRALTQQERTDVFNLGTNGDPLVTPNQFFVALATNDSNAGTVSGNGGYANGAEVPIDATPNSGYVFVEWTGDFAGSPSSFTHTISSNVSATAVFGEDTADSDGDGLTNYEEVVLIGTLPDNPDTDGDEIPDGDEWNTSFTDPLVDDSALVDFVRTNLCEDNAGIIAMSNPSIAIDPNSGNVTLTLGFQGAPDQINYSTVIPQTLVPVTGGWEVTLPAPSASVDSYILRAAGQ